MHQTAGGLWGEGLGQPWRPSLLSCSGTGFAFLEMSSVDASSWGWSEASYQTACARVLCVLLWLQASELASAVADMLSAAGMPLDLDKQQLLQTALAANAQLQQVC